MDRIKLTELFAHEKWANKEHLRAAGENPSEYFIGLISHVIHAQNFWIDRLNDKKNPNYSSEAIELSVMSDCIDDNYEKILQIVKLKDYEENVKYKNSKGEECSNSTIDILMHLLLHSQYHRGQIAVNIKSEGHDVPSTDYIFYKR